jgi:beta-lactamase class A
VESGHDVHDHHHIATASSGDVMRPNLCNARTDFARSVPQWCRCAPRKNGRPLGAWEIGMTNWLTRRTALAGMAAVTASRGPSTAHAQAARQAEFRLVDLERRHGGRLGVAILDEGNGHRIVHRADERFALCSTFKFLAAAHVLARVDRKEERLDRRVVFGSNDLVTYSPVTKDRVGGSGMTMAEICAAAITLSDNTAGNLLLESFGGPAGLTAYLRILGDQTTRLDRIETALNEATPGDPRDTTTPGAMLETTRRLVLGEALSPASRDQLAAWLIANKTGDKRLRAGLPKGWRVGDKTGTGENGAVNDVAVAWPPTRAPIVLSVYYAESTIAPDARNAVIAEVARIAVGSL